MKSKEGVLVCSRLGKLIVFSWPCQVNCKQLSSPHLANSILVRRFSMYFLLRNKILSYISRNSFFFSFHIFASCEVNHYTSIYTVVFAYFGDKLNDSLSLYSSGMRSMLQFLGTVRLYTKHQDWLITMTCS